MDRKRHDDWVTALAMMDRGEEVPSELHYVLLKKGMFDGLNAVDRLEKAIYVVKYWLRGMDLSPIGPRGELEAKNWFTICEHLGLERQAEKLRAMVAASSENPDYWDALNFIAARLHEQRAPFPDELADWAMKFHLGNLKKPPKLQSNRGQPSYAQNSRNMLLSDVFGLLGYLGLESKMERYDAIAEARSMEADTVRKAVSKGRKVSSRLPLPWEVWPMD